MQLDLSKIHLDYSQRGAIFPILKSCPTQRLIKFESLHMVVQEVGGRGLVGRLAASGRCVIVTIINFQQKGEGAEWSDLRHIIIRLFKGITLKDDLRE